MTIVWTIGWILLATAFAVGVYNILHMLEGKSKAYLLPWLVVIGMLMILGAMRAPALDKYYGVEEPKSYEAIMPDAYNEGYETGKKEGLDTGHDIGFEGGYDYGYREGYKRAIEEAVLVTVMEDGSYIISFNGEDNVYTCNVTINNNK